ncbi:DNA primase TraC [Andreprevotia sp. IGB-42]|uniref:DUF5710 domain-containing protein n=1 Tax=Andreprevotia sp. IGB-42 TaxID=2497473 RepID=UPI00135C99AB|nr:DUF5710 domain-containing protein [Andreprevotia sp. IGB-42]KAF0811790.1 DNA primase TraC [Andreprevotia sp. IGB-42]
MTGAGSKPLNRSPGTHKIQLYLNVPFAEKDKAKALGARFDGGVKRWYVPHGVDVGLFQPWLPDDAAQVLQQLADAPAAAKRAKPALRSVPADSGRPVTARIPFPDFVAYAGDEAPWL